MSQQDEQQQQQPQEQQQKEDTFVTDNSPVASPHSRSDRSVSPSASTSSYESSASTAATSVTGEDLTDKLGLSQLNEEQQQPDLSDGVTPESLSNPVKEKKKKDGSLSAAKKTQNKTSSRISSNTGISSAVPVTGERPKPEAHPSLEDSVFNTIFQILYDYDAEAKGMTVKQICDVLAEKHPDLANLSTKTSNLVSAKLNAYVKRVEKGERDIIYALSRDWADASPKRMVYVYRGLLTPDYFITAKKLWAKLEAEGTLFPDRSKDEEKKLKKEEKKMLAAAGSTGATPDISAVSNTPSALGSPSASSISSPVAGNNSKKQRRATMFDLGLNRNASSSLSFAETSMDLRIPTLSVPYQVAPVTASLSQQEVVSDDNNNNATGGNVVANSSSSHQPRQKAWLKTKDEFDLNDEFDSFDDDFGTASDEYFNTRITYKEGNKRSKSMSFASNKKSKHVTAAAAAPRVMNNNNPQQQAAMQAVIAAFKELSPTTLATEEDQDLEMGDHQAMRMSFSSSSSPSPKQKKRASFVADVSVSARWLQTVRSGFLTQEIRLPEEIPLSELDSMFE